MKNLLLAISLLSLVGCTENQRAKNFGGTQTVEIERGAVIYYDELAGGWLAAKIVDVYENTCVVTPTEHKGARVSIRKDQIKTALTSCGHNKN